MPLTYEQYQQKKQLLASGGDFSPEAVAKVQKAIFDYEDQFLGKAKGDEAPLAPGESMRVLGPGAGAAMAPTQDQLAQRVLSQLDPTHPIAPQVLSISPATTHPDGDDAAKDEWHRGDLSNPNGRVVVYEAPAKVVREALLANPQLYKSFGFSVPLTPEAVMSIQPGDSTVQAYNDDQWRQVADAAAKAGKTAYRYSKAPWLGDGNGAGVLDSLTTKVGAAAKPAAESATAFVMGVDQTAAFGAGRAAVEAVNPELKDPTFGQERAGGIPDSDARTHNATVQEEHPVLYGLGQGLGVLAPWGVANKVFGATIGAASKVAAPVAEAAGAAGGLIRGGAAVAGAGVAGGAVQAGEEVVHAGANLARTGETGTTAREAAGRIGDAARTAAVIGAVGHGAVSAARGVGNWVREGEYLEGLPGRIERQGVEPKLGRGYVDPPAVRSAKAEAKAGMRDDKPIDVFAERLDKPLTEASKAHVEGTNLRVKQRKAAVYASPEGKKLLPAENLAKESLGQLRKRTASIRGAAPTPVGTPNAATPVKGIFNTNIEGVSVTPKEGWIPVPVREAAAYLSPTWRQRATRAASSPANPVMRAGTNLARAEEAGAAGGELAARQRYRGQRPDQLEAGESRALVPVRRYQEPRARQLNEAVPKAPGAEHPELQASETRFSPEGPDHRRVSPRPEPAPTESTGGGRLAREARDARFGESFHQPKALPAGERPTAREVPRQPEPRPGLSGEPKSVPDAEFTQPRRRATFKPKGAPDRTTPATPSTAEGKARREAVEPRAFMDEMKRRGVKTVYVAPRRYNAQHHESAIAQLQRKGADTKNDRDLGEIYRGALDDRRARPLGGKPGAWSEMQEGHHRDVGAAKDTQRRVAPKKTGAYKNVIKLSRQREGQSRDQRAMEDTAARAGGNALEQLRGSRVMQPMAKLRARSSFGKDSRGQRRGWFGVPVPQVGDLALMRGIYPLTRKLEKQAGAMAGKAGRLTRVPQDADDAKAERRKSDAAKAPEYEKKVAALPHEKRSGGSVSGHKRRRVKVREDQ